MQVRRIVNLSVNLVEILHGDKIKVIVIVKMISNGIRRISNVLKLNAMKIIKNSSA